MEMHHPVYTQKQRFKYFFGGFLVGCLFPLIAFYVECQRVSLPCTLTSLRQIQNINPLILIIELVPFLAGFLAVFIGDREHKLLVQNLQLEEHIQERSQEIFEQKLFYEAVFNNSPAAIVTLDANHKIVTINPAFKNLFGYSLKEVAGIDLDDIISSDLTAQQAKDYTTQVLEGQAIHGVGERRRKDGSFVSVDIFGQPIIIDGKRVGVLGMYTDITERLKAEEAIQQSELRYRGLFNSSPVSLWEIDFSEIRKWIDEISQNGLMDLDAYFANHTNLCDAFAKRLKIIDVNQATITMFGAQDKQELINRFAEIFSEASASSLRKILLAFADGQQNIEQETPHKKLNGDDLFSIVRLSIIPGYKESWERVHVSIIDISERKWAEDRLKHLSLHDTLTGLYNRTFFEAELSRLSKSRMFPISIIVGDMDNLKEINDKFGHRAGDEAIRKAGEFIRNSLRLEDIIARMGGDEFSVLLPNTDMQTCQQIISRLEKSIQIHNQTCELKDEQHRLAISFGYTTAAFGESLEEAYKLADARMYQVKRKGGKNTPTE